MLQLPHLDNHNLIVLQHQFWGAIANPKRTKQPFGKRNSSTERENASRNTQFPLEPIINYARYSVMFNR